MLEHGWWSIEAEYARMVVADALEKHTDAEKLTAHDVLLLARDAQLLEYSAGVADPTSSAPVRFRNRLLQHYLAACVFRQSGMSARAARRVGGGPPVVAHSFFLCDDQLMQESRFRNAAHASLVRLVLGAGTSALSRYPRADSSCGIPTAWSRRNWTTASRRVLTP